LKTSFVPPHLDMVETVRAIVRPLWPGMCHNLCQTVSRSL